jgi:L-alanine-DL-glutamate epimerase-like enolase superfamily enzyme
MKITDIEIIPIYPRIAARNEDYQVRFSHINHRTVFKVHTDTGLVGYGDYRCGPPPRSSVEPLIGCNPFDFLHNNLNPGLGGALYDVMGKILEVPAYKLMGPKVREAVSVAAWTRPASPECFREEILRAVAQGYTLFKMHTCEYYDVLEQTRAAEEVAPEGFKIHYDFNGNRTLAAVLPLLRELEQSPIVGYVEDPLVRTDIDGWRRLREKVRIPLVMHVPPLGGLQEILHGMADAYMVGEGGIGNTLARGFACGAANVQTILQLTGGTLTKALALHMAAVLPTATGHSINLDDQYEEDITRERIPVTEGYSPVPEGPGLGIEVDEEALARVAANQPTTLPRHVGILHLPGGHKLYTPSFPAVSRLTGREEGTIRGLKLELWEDDGSPEFAQLYERVQKEGVVTEGVTE